jgi:hypothetical protein
MEVRLHFVMFEELEGSAGAAGLNAAGSAAVGLSAAKSDTPVGEPPAIARISIVRGADPGDVDFDFEEGL